MEISQLMSEIEKSLRYQTGFDEQILKLPPTLALYSVTDIEYIITKTIENIVKSRGIALCTIQGSELEEKIKGTVQWITGPKWRSCLLLQGAVGTGKTTLAEALYHLYYVVDASICKIYAPKLIECFELQMAGVSHAYEEYKTTKRLYIDELGSESPRSYIYGTEYTPIQNLITYRYNRQLPTIITTNLTDSMITQRYGERIADRFNEMCSVLYFSGPSFRT